MNLKLFLFLLTFFVLNGCGQQNNIEEFVPKKEVNFAKNFVAILQARDFKAYTDNIAQKLKENPDLQNGFNKLTDFFPHTTPKEIKIVGVNSFTNRLESGQPSYTNITMQYRYPDRYLLFAVNIQQGGIGPVVGVTVIPLKDSLENLNRFTFKGKGAIHFLLLATTVLVPCVMLWALILCVKTPIPKRKWLWILFIMTGFYKLKFNWSDGYIDFLIHRMEKGFTVEFISIQFFGSGVERLSVYSPWVLITSIPVGAIIFLVKRKQWLITL